MQATVGASCNEWQKHGHEQVLQEIMDVLFAVCEQSKYKLLGNLTYKVWSAE